MLIPIKVGEKKYKIKPIIELTTKEFIELSKIKDVDAIKYITWQTGEKFKNVFFGVISKGVEDAIGVAPDITKMELPKDYDYTKIIDRVGLRHQIESCSKEGLELLVYALSVSQAYDLDISKVNKKYDEYMNEPFAKVLPAGFFFFKSYANGNKKGISILKRLTRMMKIRNLKKRPAQIT